MIMEQPIFIYTKNRIYAESEDGELLAEILFPEVRCNVYDITHTFVSDKLRGMGIAGKLVQEAVRQIESFGGKVTATCSYADDWLKKHRG